MTRAKLCSIVFLVSSFILAFSAFLPSFSARAFPPIERTTLTNGLRLLLSEDHSLPFVTFQLIVGGGSRVDPPGKEGLSYITARGLLHGTPRHTAQRLSLKLDGLGASLNSNSSKDYLSVSLRVLKKDYVEGFHLLMDILTEPAFPADELSIELQRTLGSIRSVEEDPRALAMRDFENALFTSTPYGHPVMGTAGSIGTVKREDLVWFHDSFIRPNNTILVIVGDVTFHEIQRSLLDRLASWAPRPTTPPVCTQNVLSRPNVQTRNRDVSQTSIVLGNILPPRDNPDFFSLVVMNYILGGGGFSSRLFNKVRASHGLSYSVQSSLDFKKCTGSFSISLQTKNENAQKAISMVVEEIKRLQRELVTDQEIDGARKYLTGSFPLRLDTQAKVAGLLAQIEFFGLGLDYADSYASKIRAVTKEDILRVAKKYLDPENYVLVAVGNLQAAGFMAAIPGGTGPETAR